MSNQNTVEIMRQGSNPKSRSRGRGTNNNASNKKNGSVRTGSFDGTQSPRVRGNAHQLLDKYLALARDATTVGDRVLAENYFQHADHYYRLMSVAGNNDGRGPRQPAVQATPASPEGPKDGEKADDRLESAEEDGEEGTEEAAAPCPSP